MYVPLCTVVVVSTSTIMCTVYMLICNWPFKRETSTVLIGISSLLLLNMNFFSQLEHSHCQKSKFEVLISSFLNVYTFHMIDAFSHCRVTSVHGTSLLAILGFVLDKSYTASVLFGAALFIFSKEAPGL